MTDITPCTIANREFVALPEEEIHRLNRIEARKFVLNPEIEALMDEVEEELDYAGNWEEHWIALDAGGNRVFARIYYAIDQAIAITADGRIIKQFSYQRPERELH